MGRFVVVTFVESNDVSVAWLNKAKTKCFWPKTSAAAARYVRNCIPPTSSWIELSVKVFKDKKGNVKYYGIPNIYR